MCRRHHCTSTYHGLLVGPLDTDAVRVRGSYDCMNNPKLGRIYIILCFEFQLPSTVSSYTSTFVKSWYVRTTMLDSFWWSHDTTLRRCFALLSLLQLVPQPNVIYASSALPLEKRRYGCYVDRCSLRGLHTLGVLHLYNANATIVTDLNVQTISCLRVKLSTPFRSACILQISFLQVKFLQQDSGQDGSAPDSATNHHADAEC